MSREMILVIEDDDDISELVKYNLEKEGYRVSCAPSGEAGLGKIAASQPDLVILDLMLPAADGLTVCKDIRANPATKKLPVIMLTAKTEEVDMVTGLEVGADDYVTKPFSPRVLLARVRAVLRRGHEETVKAAPKIIKRGDIEIDPAKHEVRVKGRLVEATGTEFKLLQFLAERPGMVFNRDQIVDAVHGADYPVTDRSVDVQIVGLRKKLGSSSECIETVRGVGYRFHDGSR